MSEVPMLKQFRQALEAHTATPSAVRSFDTWRQNPQECSGETKLAADQLWERYQAVKESAATGIQARAPTADRVRPGEARRGPPPSRVTNAGSGDPSVLGEPFHNPYTFIPFPGDPPQRHRPTPLTVDEIETERFTGILDLELQLLSPLLTNSPEAQETNGHRTHRALAIGPDVIVPASGIRGSLRSLMSLLTGGTLGYVDEEAWLCQGRDARLGPAGPQTSGVLPRKAFLAEVVRPGGFNRSGQVRLGTTRLVLWDKLQCKIVGTPPRPGPQAAVKHLWVRMDSDEVVSVKERKDDDHVWKLKLSGRPVMLRGKREGLFMAGDTLLTIPSSLWSAYTGRNRHGDHPTLRVGDLVWLEPKSVEAEEIQAAEEVKSIQWARWGREGERLLDVVAQRHAAHLPDSINPDGLVDEVTDLFGHVPRPDLTDEVHAYSRWKERGLPGPAPAFSARVRPGNLVFKDALRSVKPVTLAPLQPPHPGCAAFYRNAGSNPAEAADVVGNHGFGLRGFKVYRTSSQHTADAPWPFATQGVYDTAGALLPQAQRVNKTCDVLHEGVAPRGSLRLTIRALSRRELMLLLAACAVDWRLGGGKPLGLGHCRVSRVSLREFRDDGTLGDPLDMSRGDAAMARLPEPYASLLDADRQLAERMRMWQASQQEVERLRYPRAVDQNRNKISRGGHVWFQRHAQARKADQEGGHPAGLQVLHVDGDLKEKAGGNSIRAQPLPVFNPERPRGDVLYGFDLFAGEGEEWRVQMSDRRTLHRALAPFNPDAHVVRAQSSGGFQGGNRQSRQEGRRNR